ncbi:MAG: hypothetical protein PSV35_01655, partial [bacterium]|nr:hypothetical protein [bacterium]
TDHMRPDLSLLISGNKELFTLWASKKHPKQFSYSVDKYQSSVLKIHKTTKRWVLPRFTISSSSIIPSVKINDDITLEELKKGNALMFAEVTAEKAQQNLHLRSLKI